MSRYQTKISHNRTLVILGSLILSTIYLLKKEECKSVTLLLKWLASGIRTSEKITGSGRTMVNVNKTTFTTLMNSKQRCLKTDYRYIPEEGDSLNEEARISLLAERPQ